MDARTFRIRRRSGVGALAAALVVSGIIGYVLIGREEPGAAPSLGHPATLITTPTVQPVAVIPRLTPIPRSTLLVRSIATATHADPARIYPNPLPTLADPTPTYVEPAPVRPTQGRTDQSNGQRRSLGSWRDRLPKATTKPPATLTPGFTLTPLPTATAGLVAPQATPSETLTLTPRPTVGIAPTTPDLPIRLRIPVINLDAHIESVGLSGDAMDVPANPWDVAWFNLGPRPGQLGNAVIDGHLDTATSSAVFLHLGDLRGGDLLYVITAAGVEHTFKVTETAVYPVGKAPLAHIFGANKTAHLNLITCSGDWLPQQQNYNERLVVYSTLVA